MEGARVSALFRRNKTKHTGVNNTRRISSVSSSPCPRPHLLIAKLAGCEDTSRGSPSVNALSEAEWVLALGSEANCVASRLNTSGQKGKTARSSTKTSLSCFFLFFSVITNYKLKKRKKNKNSNCIFCDKLEQTHFSCSSGTPVCVSAPGERKKKKILFNSTNSDISVTSLWSNELCQSWVCCDLYTLLEDVLACNSGMTRC